MKALSDCRVLVVDDARTNLDILVEALKHDYKVSVALNGEMALLSAARATPDLVLLDILMPGIDGYETCRRLRQMPEMAEVPIIFLSALDEAPNKARGFEAGANDYVTKPFETLEVQARVRSLLRAKAYNDSVKEQLAAELRIARDIQLGMIPRKFAPFQNRFGGELAGLLEPAREVGGDLFGVFVAEGSRLVLVMGDVSGKGIPASLFMVRADTLVRLLARQIRDPEQILIALNEELSDDNPSDMFVTLVCAVLDPATGRLALANGGHTPPVLLRPGAPPRWAIPDLGTALGLERGLAFPRVELTLQRNDTLVFYTDGVTEAFNPEGDCYGSKRLLALLDGLAPGSSSEVTDRLLQDIRAFASGAPQSDDIAVLAMRLGTPPNGTAREGPPVLRLELQATPQEVMRGVERLESFCQQERLPESLVFGLKLALEEVSTNIVTHAYHNDPHQRFTVLVELLHDRIRLQTRDAGPAFNPLEAPLPTAAPEADLSQGGVGLYLAHHYLDELVYQREANENVLLMSRRLPVGTPEPPANAA